MAVTPPPLGPLLEQWAVYLTLIHIVGYEVVNLILTQVRKEYSAANLSSSACMRECSLLTSVCEQWGCVCVCLYNANDDECTVLLEHNL
jgi:hypothetical protein